MFEMPKFALEMFSQHFDKDFGILSTFAAT